MSRFATLRRYEEKFIDHSVVHPLHRTSSRFTGYSRPSSTRWWQNISSSVKNCSRHSAVPNTAPTSSNPSPSPRFSNPGWNIVRSSSIRRESTVACNSGRSIPRRSSALKKNTGCRKKSFSASSAWRPSLATIWDDYRALDALTTLAFDYPRRADFFRDELEQYLLLAREQGFDLLSVQSSYAGALGIPQFMPSSYRRYAVDFNHNGKIDIMNEPEDAIGSVANYLKQYGWRSNEPVALQCKVEDEKRLGVIGEARPFHCLARRRRDAADANRKAICRLHGCWISRWSPARNTGWYSATSTSSCATTTATSTRCRCSSWPKKSAARVTEACGGCAARRRTLFSNSASAYPRCAHSRRSWVNARICRRRHICRHAKKTHAGCCRTPGHPGSVRPALTGFPTLLIPRLVRGRDMPSEWR